MMARVTGTTICRRCCARSRYSYCPLQTMLYPTGSDTRSAISRRADST